MPEYMCPHCHAVFAAHRPNCPNDGSILIEVPVLSDLSGKVLKQKYRLEKALGHGGFGSVYRATHLVLGKQVAVKVLRAEFRNDSTMVARFFNEARVVTRLTNSHTINTFDLDQAEEGFLFMVMDFVEGKTLRELAKIEGDPPGRLPWPRALQLLIQVCESLEEAHRAGVIHRDLKPDNIMVSNRGGAEDFVTVLDFGIAKVVEGTEMQNLTAAGMLLGSPAYMSPEQVKGDPLGPASDIYAFGVIAYQILSGLLPVSARQTAAILQEKILSRPEPLSRKVPGLVLPLELENLVMTMLEVDIEARPTSASEVRERLTAILAAGGEAVPAQPGAHTPTPPAGSGAGTVGYESPETQAAQGNSVPAAPPNTYREAHPVPTPEATPSPSPDEEPTRVPGIVTRSSGPNRRLLGGLAIVAVVLVAVAVGLAVGIGSGKQKAAGPDASSAVATADVITTANPVEDVVTARPAARSNLPKPIQPAPQPDVSPPPDVAASEPDLLSAPETTESVDVEQPILDVVADLPAPVEAGKEPVEARKEPVQAKKEPVEAKKEPVEAKTEPVEDKKEPVEAKKEPVEAKKEPVEAKKEPVEAKKEPVEAKKEPVEEKKEPVEEKKEPVKEPFGVVDLKKGSDEAKAIAKEVEDELRKEMKALDEELDPDDDFGTKDHIDKAFDELDGEDPW